jgi:AcrR family transcriptional regulator
VPEVKRASRRQAKAALTRIRMLTAAYELFCEFGFRATTMEAIAERAGVAVQTIYFTFHTKDELLQSVHDWTVLGDDPTPPPLQAWYLDAVSEPNARRSLEMIIEGVVSIEARVAPMLPVFHAVSADPAGEVYSRSQQLRREGFEDIIEMLTKKAPLRRGLTRRRATDLLFVLAGPESYRSFVLESGWTTKQWTSWVSATLARDLFGDDYGVR